VFVSDDDDASSEEDTPPEATSPKVGFSGSDLLDAAMG